MTNHIDFTNNQASSTNVGETPSCILKSGESQPVFGLTSRVGISSYWRKNTSPIESAELAKLLRALRKVAGYLGSNIGRIEYTGMSSSNDSAILIEPEMVMGKYPVPSTKFDILVGIVVHEALHKIEWSDHVWKTLEPDMEKMPPIQRIIFQKIVFTGEDIYIDIQADQTIFGLYTRLSREEALRRDGSRINSSNVSQKVSDDISIDELIRLWQSSQFQNIRNRMVLPEYNQPLLKLDLLRTELFNIKKVSSSVLNRCEQRTRLYLDTWEKIKSQIHNWRVIDKQLYWFSENTISASGKRQTTSLKDKKQTVLPSDLIQEIETHLSIDSVNITPIIKSIVGYDNDTVVPMSRWDFNIPSHPVIDKNMIGRLKRIFTNYAARKVAVNRGLLSGKIDPRRLYRAHVTGKCFKEVSSMPCPDWSVGLLIDASGSMRGNKWKMVENTVANIHKALTGYRNHLNAWAYFEVNGICMISRLIQENNLLSIPPSGQTASGQAIIAAASMMPKKIKRNILIHITDGESNFGCDVSFGIEFCKQQKIHLITLGCGYRDKDVMEKQYNRAIQFIDYFEQLPQAMEKLLKWAFLYGDKKTVSNK